MVFRCLSSRTLQWPGGSRAGQWRPLRRSRPRAVPGRRRRHPSWGRRHHSHRTLAFAERWTGAISVAIRHPSHPAQRDPCLRQPFRGGSHDAERRRPERCRRRREHQSDADGASADADARRFGHAHPNHAQRPEVTAGDVWRRHARPQRRSCGSSRRRRCCGRGSSLRRPATSIQPSSFHGSRGRSCHS